MFLTFSPALGINHNSIHNCVLNDICSHTFLNIHQNEREKKGKEKHFKYWMVWHRPHLNFSLDFYLVFGFDVVHFFPLEIYRFIAISCSIMQLKEQKNFHVFSSYIFICVCVYDFSPPAKTCSELSCRSNDWKLE